MTLVAALFLAGCGGSKPHFTARPTPLVSIFEAPLELGTKPGPTLDLLRHLGVDDVRVVMRWSSVAPAASSQHAPAGFAAESPTAYPAAAWAPYDAIVRAAAARKMGVLLNVSGPAPIWATGKGTVPGGVPGVWKPSAADFQPFVHAVAVRYSGNYTPPGEHSPLPRISFWSIWNEPNLGQANLAPQAIDNSAVESSPRMYRGLVDSAWASLQATGHGQDTILIGELAPYGQSVGRNVPGTFGYMVPMRFVRALYCVNAALRPLRGSAAAARGCPTTPSAAQNFAPENPGLFHASGFAVHPYPSGTAPPNLVLPAGPEFVYLATLDRLTRFLDRVTNLYGASRRYVLYSTEYGYITNPPFAHGVPLSLAAGYLNWAEYLTWRNLRLRSWDQYLLVDPPTGGPSNFDTGLEADTGKLKPTFAAYRFPIFLPVTNARKGHGIEVWGCLRPVHYTSRPQDVLIQLQPGGHGAFQTIETVRVTDPNGYFDLAMKFPSSGQVRLTWTYPHGETIHSRLVPIRVG